MSSSLPALPKLMTTKWSSLNDSNNFDVVNPATGQVLTTVAGGDIDTAAAAVEASQKAFNSWRWLPPAQRAGLLIQCSEALEKHSEELARLLCLENGKPYQDALLFDVGFLLGAFRYFGSLADKLPDQFFDRGSMYATVMREPYGVCVGILPFNWPPIHLGGKLTPCLAAGNTMIIKPGDQTPLTVLRAVEILQTVLPPDVVIAVPARGPTVPQALVANPAVRAVSFTVHDAFVDKLSAGVRKIVTGNGMDPKTHVGPCVNKVSQERVLRYIQKGKEEGATVAAQGALPSSPEFQNGSFVAPTLFINVTPQMTIAREEMFGPVSVVIKFSTEDEAVSISNDSVYGLTAVLFSKDHERCLRVARKLDVGMIFFNQYNRAVLGTPFGGANHSGYGREHCIDTLREWTRAKAIHQPSGLHAVPQWRAVKDCL
uniref:aldehyde dehydrogenase (NAD(+)) n=1 Tax=Bionectria ochroleuca TaxID=29856 RepID=A0A0B7K8P6_BIOOC